MLYIILNVFWGNFIHFLFQIFFCVLKDVAKDGLKEAALAIAESNPELMPLLPVANAAIDKAIGCRIVKKPRKLNARAQIVKQVISND